MKTLRCSFVSLVMALALFAVALPVVHAAPAVSGSIALGSVATDLIHLGGAPQRPDSMVAELTLNVKNLVGRVSAYASYRVPFYGNSFWNAHMEKFEAGLTVPVGYAECFGTFERNPFTGFEYAWVGVRIPFQL